MAVTWPDEGICPVCVDRPGKVGMVGMGGLTEWDCRLCKGDGLLGPEETAVFWESIRTKHTFQPDSAITAVRTSREQNQWR